MGLLTSRRAKIRSHTHARLAQQARQQMEERLSGASGGASSIYDGRLGGLEGLEDAMQREQTRFLSIHVPTRKLFFLAAYSALLLLLSSPWLSHSPLFSRLHVGGPSLAAAGAALSGALSMVTGLLIGYRSNQALRKWERGREVWMVQLRSEVRDALRMISLIGPSSRPAQARPQALQRHSSSDSSESVETRMDRSTLLDQRSQELLAVIVAFVFALQHHLDGTRPALNVPSADPGSKYPPLPSSPVDPLVDLLPLGYIASLRRTPARVRFAESDEDGATSAHSHDGRGAVTANGDKSRSASLEVPHRGSSPDIHALKTRRTGVGREQSRSPSPRTAAVRARMRSGISARSQLSGASSDDASAGDQDGARHASALAPSASKLNARPASHREISIQLAQLNLPPVTPPPTQATASESASRGSRDAPSISLSDGDMTPSPRRRDRPRNPVLSSRHPRNLPLAVLRLMQCYVDSFAQEGERDRQSSSKARPKRRGAGGENNGPEADGGADGLQADTTENEDDVSWGWTLSQAEKGWSATRSFSKILAEAELLSEDPPPLSLSTHLRVLLTLFLASVPLTAVPTLGRGGIVIALVAGWAFWGLEQASEELGGVFGTGANHIPIRAYAYRVLDESLSTCPAFKRAYLARVRLRTGVNPESEDASGDDAVRSDASGTASVRRGSDRQEEWLPTF